jgi:uncharacterized membrane protein YjgN (DUF898 family)
MGIASMRCSKCGYTQLASPTCKSCGAAIGGMQAVPPLQAQSLPPQPKAKSAPAAQPPPQSQPRPPQPKPEADPIHRPSFHGSGGSLFGIHIINIFLTLLTLGIYYFWGKVRVRNYLLSESEFVGDRFAYHGTGKELLIGFLKAVLIFGGLSALFRVAPLLPGGMAVKAIAGVIAYAALLVFISIAMVSARRYRLSRTSWRGIRFSFRGKILDFVKLYIGGTLLSMITLGIYYPVFKTRRYAFMASESYFGNQKFSFDGKGKDVYKIYFQAFLFFLLCGIGLTFLLRFLAIYIFGLASQWFSPNGQKILMVSVMIMTVLITLIFPWSFLVTEQKRYFWNHTSFASARFESTMTFGPFLLLKLGNFFLLVFSLGLAWPLATVRNVRFAFKYLSMEGPLNFEAIQQEAQAASPTGDALDSFLGLDTGFDIA